MKSKIVALIILMLFVITVNAQITPADDLMQFYTQEWEGQRDDEGRPLVSDNLLERLKNISIE